MSNTSFHFRHMLLLSAHSSQSHATSCSSLMSHHQVNNTCNRVKGQHWRWLIYALRHFSLRNNMLCVFRSNHHCSWKFHEFHGKTPVLKSLFFLKLMKLYKDFIKLYKGFIIYENIEKKSVNFTTSRSIYTGHRHFEVLWSFILYIL